MHRIFSPGREASPTLTTALKLRDCAALYAVVAASLAAPWEVGMSTAHGIRGSAQRVGAAFAVTMVAACAMPDSLRPGATEIDVRTKLGKPDSEFILPDGTKRFEYNRGEFM